MGWGVKLGRWKITFGGGVYRRDGTTMDGNGGNSDGDKTRSSLVVVVVMGV